MYNANVKEDTAPSRILAVDWGRKRLGIAISDHTCRFARPLTIIKHISRLKDVERILVIAKENNVKEIVVGITYDDENNPTPSGRSILRLVKVIKENGLFPVRVWNEEGSTKKAVKSQVTLDVPRKKRKGHHDAIAAAIILQDFLDSDANKK